MAWQNTTFVGYGVNRLTPRWPKGSARRAAERPTVTVPVAEPPAERLTTLPPRCRPGRFVELRLLGDGATATVMEVYDRHREEFGVMKVIRADLAMRTAVIARFRAESQCLRRLDHPGVVPLREIGRLADGRTFLLFPRLHGRTLRRDLELAPRPPPEALLARLRVVQAVAEVLAHAHAHGIVHRDVKPENIFVEEGGGVRLLDWGLGWCAESADAEALARRGQGRAGSLLGEVVGTPAYMAPESARGEVRPGDPLVDVYGLGAVLYEVLAGRAPYDGETAAQVIAQVLAGPPDLAPLFGGVDPDTATALEMDRLVDACRQAMARERTARIADMAQLVERLGAWLGVACRRERARSLCEEAALHVTAARRVWARMDEHLARARASGCAFDDEDLRLLADQARLLAQDGANLFAAAQELAPEVSKPWAPKLLL